MEFKEELINLLNDSRSGIQSPQFDLASLPNDRVGGFVISKTFAGMPQIDRQNLIWDYLDKEMQREKLRRIVSLITLTPAEASEN